MERYLRREESKSVIRSLSTAITDEEHMASVFSDQEGRKRGRATRDIGCCQAFQLQRGSLRWLSQSLKTQLRSLFKMPQKANSYINQVGPSSILTAIHQLRCPLKKKILVDSRHLIKDHENDTMSRRLLILLFFLPAIVLLHWSANKFRLHYN